MVDSINDKLMIDKLVEERDQLKEALRRIDDLVHDRDDTGSDEVTRLFAICAITIKALEEPPL